MSNAPGLQRREGAGGRVVFYWSARHASRKAKGYPLKTRRLITDDENEAAAQCRILTAELRQWIEDNGKDKAPEFDGTIASLIECYQRDEDSPYHGVKQNTRRDYDDSLAILRKSVGAAEVAVLNGRDFTRWHREFKTPAEDGGPERLRRAHGCMKLLRTIAGYGTSMRYAGCAEIAVVLEKMRFELPEARDSSLSFEQAEAIVDLALAKGRRSIALAQALQFETTLRQKDVIGEWLFDVSGSGIENRGHRWASGVLWSDLSPDLILRKKTTKKGKTSEWNLALCPLVMKVLPQYGPEERIGPMIISEGTRRPYRDNNFQRTWRELANEAGVPRGIWNMDSRAGGLTEADEAGADPHDIQRHATHSDLKTTGRYVRRNRQANERVAVLRVKSRKKNDT